MDKIEILSVDFMDSIDPSIKRNFAAERYVKAYREHQKQMRISKLEQMMDSDPSEAPFFEEND
jgi:hypothetical protein